MPQESQQLLEQFLLAHQADDVNLLALQRARYPEFSDSVYRFALQQIDGRQRTQVKHPLFGSISGWHYPPRINLEQSSSELTARYKAALIQGLGLQTIVDGTGGYGADTFFMSAGAVLTHYFEQNSELASLAEHNFRIAGKDTIICHREPFDISRHAPCLAPLAASADKYPALLYLDPARRNTHGGKVFRLEDCTPNVSDILTHPLFRQTGAHIMLKLSPMLDIRQALAQLGGNWTVYIVSVENEVKELLFLSAPVTTICATELAWHPSNPSSLQAHEWAFKPEQEAEADCRMATSSTPMYPYIYEPNAAIRKAGAFRLTAQQTGTVKADENTHLYLTERPEQTQVIPLGGRIWRISQAFSSTKKLMEYLTAHTDKGRIQANIVARNYGLSADALRAKLKIKDGGEQFIIACRIAGKPILLLGEPVRENMQNTPKSATQP